MRKGNSSSQSRRASRSRSATSTAARVAGRLHQDPSVGVADERRAVERDGRARAQVLGADAVDGDHEGAVGDALADDHRVPQRLGVEAGVVGLGADGRGVDQHLGPGQGVGAAQLGEPLVPTGGEAEAGLVDRHHREAPVSSDEVAVLVVAGRHRDVHLPGGRHQRPVRRHQDGGVVAAAVGRRAPLGVGHRLVERGVDEHAVVGRQHLGQPQGGAAGERLGLGPARAWPPVRHREVRAQGELLEAHHPRPLRGSQAHPGGQVGQVVDRRRGPRRLHGADPERGPLRRAGACGRIGDRPHRGDELERHQGAHPARMRRPLKSPTTRRTRSKTST